MKPGAELDCYRDLAWLGLDWDEGPAAASGAGRPAPGDPFVQSDNSTSYLDLIREWRRRGLIYPCVCTRRDIENCHSAPNAGEEFSENRYPGTCRERFGDAREAVATRGREPAWRFRIDDGEETAFADGFIGGNRSRLGAWSGDFVVARGDRAGYQLAVVADDIRHGITEVVRGDDLVPSTHRQLVLYRALGCAPPSFYHIPVVVGADGKRLSKRHGDSRIGELRRRGDGPERVLGWLAWSCGWLDRPEAVTLDAIMSICDFAAIPRARAVADRMALEWIGFS